MKKQGTAATGTVCNPELFEFPAVKRRAVQASFTGADVTSDGGIALLRQVDRKLDFVHVVHRITISPVGAADSTALSVTTDRIINAAANSDTVFFMMDPRIWSRSMKSVATKHLSVEKGLF